ncbi:NADPH-dependent aldo-keto reductase, chloroplastic isoform X2 [Cryptomeria japonica]|uniref:NADPH-dependent aldo-keto reductase, chloroplastic isoform X2 n=1 Tax=Cryptomeria japonica TaxID=3369 RepID=UPI0027DAA4C7|nr:NADPH-dependent aldo-keto reductase, chloroplastic isoform X2 [Cryptomeria japonica]
MEIIERVSQLNSGMKIPRIGFGTAASPQNIIQMKQAVATALKVGYKHFDTASIYGTEPALGEALSEAFRNGIAKRDDVFVTSKMYAADHDDPVSALKTSLKNLQLEYLDLYLIHWPINLRKGVSHPSPKEEDFLPLDIESIWRGMEQCVELGLTKSIGVSNFSSKKIGDLLSYAKISPAVSQVLLRWGLEQGVSVLPKSYNSCRITENYQVFEWSLTEEDHEKISKLPQKKIVRREGLINSTTSPYKTIQDLWDGEI